MKLKILMDDKSLSSEYKSEHGLSIYMEVKGKKILFDTGKTDLFMENAKALSIELKAIDFVVISHGHYDHGGGLEAFLKVNHHAKVYVAKGAFDSRYALRPNGEKSYIGLDPSLKNHSQIVELVGETEILEGIRIFSGVESIYPRPTANGNLLGVSKVDGSIVADDFSHEQNLLIEDGIDTYLIAGCAHNGICNIHNHVTQKLKIIPSVVVGGFHLNNRREELCAPAHMVDEIGDYLLKSRATYYTGHCTGEKAYGQLKYQMGNKIHYLAAGAEIEL